MEDSEFVKAPPECCSRSRILQIFECEMVIKQNDKIVRFNLTVAGSSAPPVSCRSEDISKLLYE